MVGRIYHVGLTVSDLDKSIAFYRDILGLKYQGEIMMVGEETDKMFQKKNCKARVAYLNGSENIETPPVELIQFVDSKIHKEPAYRCRWHWQQRCWGVHIYSLLCWRRCFIIRILTIRRRCLDTTKRSRTG